MLLFSALFSNYKHRDLIFLSLYDVKKVIFNLNNSH